VKTTRRLLFGSDRLRRVIQLSIRETETLEREGWQKSPLWAAAADLARQQINRSTTCDAVFFFDAKGRFLNVFEPDPS